MKFKLKDGKILEDMFWQLKKIVKKVILGCRKRQRQAILQWAYDPYR